MTISRVTQRHHTAAATLVLFALASVAIGRSQSEGFDDDVAALTYHKVSGDPLDTKAVASRSQAAMRATNFDRPDVIAAEQQRLDAQLASMNAAREFTITIDDRITEYDHTSSQFSVELFTPGYYIPFQAFGQEYRIVFANAASARAIAMDKDQAREFDARLNSSGRQIKNEVHFKIIGKGDPTGAVNGGLVVRAEITSARVLDRSGQVLFTPKVVAAGAAPRFAGFDAAKADVAGLRVGVAKRDMEATLTRLFGKITPGYMSGGGFKGFAGSIEVNSLGCRSGMTNSRKRPQPGTVCVTAYFDNDQIVRMVRIERLFPPNFDGEVLRKSLAQKYGPASGGRSRGMSWGPGVPGAVLNSPGTSVDALTVSVAADEDISSIGANRLENVIVSMQLIDAGWAAKVAQ
jgi:uncharacterized protein DUF4852